MKILVTVKQVPDTSGKVAVNPDGTLDRASMQTIINPDDLNAVEAALALKDELGCKVVAFTMGPPPAEGMLRELMAMGVDEGVLVTAREFGGSDTYATSQIIAAAIDTYGIDKDDIILAGRQAIDGDTAQVGPQIAEKLHLPQVTYAGEITKDGDTLTVKRMLEDGYMTIKVKTPCMITCIKELNTPRYLSVGGAFECYSKPLVTMTYETLKDHPLIDKSTIGLDDDDIVFCGRQAIDGDTAQVGPQIAEKLHLPQITYAADVKKEGDTLTVKRMLEDGYMTIKAQTPCLITCIKELNTPRYMSVSGVFECYSKPMTVLDYNALKDHPLIDATTIGLKGSPTNILTSFTPPQKGAGQMLEGNDMATCEKLAGILLEKHII